MNTSCGNLLESAAFWTLCRFFQLRAGHAVIFSLERPHCETAFYISWTCELG